MVSMFRPAWVVTAVMLLIRPGAFLWIRQIRRLPLRGCTTSGMFTLFDALLVVAVILTAWSGIDYFAKGWKYIVEDE